jgi:trans-aconitate 2-methyltransferase
MPRDEQWDPVQYERFKRERAQPFWDLFDLVDTSRPLSRIVDLGCGTGELTAEAAERWGSDDAVGVDNSEAMLAKAEAFVRPGLRLEHADIAGWTSDHDYDLVFANAALQWVPDHADVLRRWVAALRPGGQLAVQVPSNAEHQSHLASVDVAHREPFLSAFGDAGPPPDPVAVNVLAPEEYSALLFELGFSQPHVRLQVYPHVLERTSDVVEWVKGTSLTRFFNVLPHELHEPFVDAYRDELIARVGDHAPYLYTFNRILMSGSVST